MPSQGETTNFSRQTSFQNAEPQNDLQKHVPEPSNVTDDWNSGLYDDPSYQDFVEDEWLQMPSGSQENQTGAADVSPVSERQ